MAKSTREKLEAITEEPSVDAELAGRFLEEHGEEKIVELFRDMTLIRRFEEQAGRAYQMGKIRGFCHLYIGQEAVAVGSMATVGPEDYIIAAYREHGHALARGLDPDAVMAELFARETGSSGGKGGSMHIFDVEKKFYGGWGIVGGHIPTAAGMAFASKYREEDAVTLCYFGEGSIHQGVFHEALNMASIWELPVVYITENNRYAMGTAIERISAVVDIQKKAVSYDMAHAQLDGNDVFAVYYGVQYAVERARNENKPTFLDVVTYRYRGHSMSDPATYRTREEVEEQQKQGPIVRLQRWMLDNDIRSEDELSAIDDEVKQIAKNAIKFAEESDFPPAEALTRDVYVEWTSEID